MEIETQRRKTDMQANIKFLDEHSNWNIVCGVEFVKYGETRGMSYDEAIQDKVPVFASVVETETDPAKSRRCITITYGSGSGLGRIYTDREAYLINNRGETIERLN
jgi:hypothetical protein